MTLTDPDLWGKLGQIVLADILLAGDNALVIALATRTLPPRQQFWGRMIGAGGAVVLRVLFVVIIGFLLKVPYLQLIGGLLLLWIAAKLVRPQPEAIHAAAHTEEGSKTRVAGTLRDAITVIIIADLTMSFDNVVAIANIAKDRATGDMHVPLVIFGLLFSIPLVVWGSSLIAKLMERFRWIVWLGGAVLGHVGGAIIFHDHQVLRWMGVNMPPPGTDVHFDAVVGAAAPWVAWVIRFVPWILAVVLFIYGWWCARQLAAENRSVENGVNS
jgi:YjbE family integral membrane protein